MIIYDFGDSPKCNFQKVSFPKSPGVIRSGADLISIYTSAIKHIYAYTNEICICTFLLKKCVYALWILCVFEVNVG